MKLVIANSEVHDDFELDKIKLEQIDFKINGQETLGILVVVYLFVLNQIILDVA